MASRNSFVKTIQIKYEVDKATIARTKQEAENMLKNVKIFNKDGIFDKEAMKKLGEDIEKALGFRQKTEDLRRVITQLKDVGKGKEAKELYESAIKEDPKLQKELKDLFANPTVKKAQENLWEGAKKGIEKAKEAFSSFFDSIETMITETLNEIMDYTITDLKYSSKAWNLYEQTGLSGSQAYAYQKAMNRVGVDNITDLYKWFEIAGEGAEERFNELMERYEKQYETDLELAKEYQEWQQEFEDFKEEITQDLLKWFAENKETIKTALKGLISFMAWVVDALAGIVSILGGETYEEDVVSESDQISNNISEGSTFTTNNATAKIYVNGGDGKSVGETAYQYLQGKLGIA